MAIKLFGHIVGACLLWGAMTPALARAEGAVGDGGDDQQRTAAALSPQEEAEIERFERKVKAQWAAIDRLLEESKDKDSLLDALVPLFEQREYNQSNYTYSKLIKLFKQSDVSPLLRAYQRTKSVEARIWLAAVADYCGKDVLLRRLRRQVKTLKGEPRTRAAIAVAFKLGDPAMVPHLIDALGSKAEFWVDFPEPAGPAAAYLLTELTNHVVGDYPNGLMNYSCFVMPPPVVPYPVPFVSEDAVDTASNSQQAWRQWWQANKSKSRKEWILAGIQRDVERFRATPDLEQLDDKLAGRLNRLLDVDTKYGDDPRQEVEDAWEAAQRDYEIPAWIAR